MYNYFHSLGFLMVERKGTIKNFVDIGIKVLRRFESIPTLHTIIEL